MSVALALLAAHALADFPLQSDRMAANKFDDSAVRARHAIVHMWVTQAFLLPVVPWDFALAGGALVSLLHFGIDTRRWAEPKDGFSAYPIAVDQSLHIAALYLVSLCIGVFI